MAISRSDYIRDCREYALGCLERGDIRSAVAAMMGDMKRLKDAVSVMQNIDAILAVERNDVDAARAYIEGFK